LELTLRSICRFSLFVTLALLHLPICLVSQESTVSWNDLLQNTERTYDLLASELELDLARLQLDRTRAEVYPALSLISSQLLSVDPTNFESSTASAGLSVAQQMPFGGSIAASAIVDSIFSDFELHPSVTHSLRLSLELTQPIATRMTPFLLHVERTRLEYQGARLSHTKKRRETITELSRLYAAAVRAQARQDSIETQTRIISDRLAEAESRFTAGLISRSDVWELEDEREEIVFESFEAYEERAATLLELAFPFHRIGEELWIDTTTRLAFPWAPNVAPEPPAANQLNAVELERELAAIDSELHRLDRIERRNSRRPSIVFGTSAMKTDGSEWAIGLSLGLQLPQFPLGRRLADAVLDRRAQLNELEESRQVDSVEMRYTTLSNRWERARKQIQIANVALDRAKARTSGLETQLAQGSITFGEALLAQLLEERRRLALIEARIELWEAEIQYRAMEGGPWE